MKLLEKGSKFKNWVIRSVVAQSLYRAEYILEPEKGHPGNEFRAIVYDVPATPESMLWNGRLRRLAAPEDVTPYELKFLRENQSPYFPKVFQHEESSSCHWAVVMTPDCVNLADYVRDNPPKDVRETLELMHNLCLALEEMGKFYDARHYNLTRSSIFITPKGQIILEGLQHVVVKRTSIPFSRKMSLRALFLAPELFEGNLSANADVFSLSLLLYSFVGGGRSYPWNVPYGLVVRLREGKISAGEFATEAWTMRKDGPDLSGIDNPRMKAVLTKGLSPDPETRFSDIAEFRTAIEGLLKDQSGMDDEAKKLLSGIMGGLMGYIEKNNGPAAPVVPAPEKPVVKTGGFADLAGMDELKEELLWKFINPIKHKSLAKSLGIRPPSGCLLYGPPGCGKTYAASKIAEEAGIRFRMCRPSDIASVYVHGGQGLIKKIFDDARKKAPILLCWDEADAIATRREMLHEHYASEVNELLTQMNNAADDGVYVFLMCNFPEKLDPAILRRGRIDERFYVPFPDEKGRAEMFELRSADLPKAGDWDYRHLASLCDGFSFADLEYVMAECRRVCFRLAVQSNRRKPSPVTQEMIEEILRRTRPSVSREDRARYEQVHDIMSGREEPRRRKIGF